MKKCWPLKHLVYLIKFSVWISLMVLITFPANSRAQEYPAPVLEKRGQAVQLIVDGQPFLLLGGELHNSSSSSRAYMKDIWPRLQMSGMNTVLAVVEWALLEPQEGHFDFSQLDGLLEDARAYNLRLVLLWFGAWKNGQSHYVPEWVKADFKRFPRVKTQNAKSLEIISPFSQATLQADARAFTALMQHLKEVDAQNRTVIMLQVQNEVGVIGATRDFSPMAEEAFNSAVPEQLLTYLSQNKANLLPELPGQWSQSAFKTTGSWAEVFGSNNSTDEIFMAWHYARYIDSCIARAKNEYDIPMFVNAWIVQPQDKKPGDYPSGGPQAHMLDIWRAAAPHIDLLCPDIYLPNFAEICALYTRNNNTLFIPESRAGEQGVSQLFYALGRHKAIGYSPFGIDSRIKDPENDPIPNAYKLLSAMAPVILEAQSKGTINSVLLNKESHAAEQLDMGGYSLTVELLKGWGTSSVPELGYGLIINTAADEFVIAAKNIQVSFSANTAGAAIAGIARVDEGSYSDGQWIARRRLNGDAIMIDYDLARQADKNKTGTGLKFSGEDRMIQRVKLYRYE
jgi:Domain of unknown function (DUF5597)/Glycosyl hydrolases family 35